MAWLRTRITVQDITDVVAQMVEHFHPQQVVLFGSYASGTPTLDSDVDLLVVMETPPRNVEQAVEIRKAVNFPFPVDLIVRTPQHIAERVTLGGCLSARGSHQGSQE
jgi:predicted nucleotidyltransferase